MKTPVSYKPGNLAFNVLMLFSGFTFMLVWLPLLRCLFDGNSYRWAQTYYGLTLASKGLSTDYLALILFFVLYLAFYFSFYWIKNRVLFYGLLVWWWLHNFGNFLYEIVSHGDSQFHGDTLNVHISLSAVVIPIAVIALVLAIWVIIKDLKLKEVNVPWGKRNKTWLLILLLPLLLQIPLFAFGAPHGTTDQIGVLIAITQALLFPVIFIPAKLKN